MRTHTRSVIAVLAIVALAHSALADVTTEQNVTYSTVGDRELQVDLARPEGEGPFPAIVFIHGGGWRAGNRAGYRGMVRIAAERGYFAMTVTYRLTDPDEGGKPTNPFPAAVHDVKAAVRWLRANAAKYDVDPERIGATGASAGGHLSLLLGTTDAKAGLEGDGGHADESSRVQAVVNYFGPTDFPRFAEVSKGRALPILESFLDSKYAGNEDRWRLASPVTHATKDDPPMLTIHGAEDRLVPVEQAQRFDAAMQKARATHELMILEGQAHGFRGESSAKARAALFRFFDEHLKGEKGAE